MQLAKGGYCSTVLGSNMPLGKAGFPVKYNDAPDAHGNFRSDQTQTGFRHRKMIRRGE